MTLKSIIPILSLLALAYLGILLFFYFMQENLLFFPTPPNQGAARHYAPYALEVDRNGTRLQGWILHPDKIDDQNPLRVYYGGNAEDVSLYLPEALSSREPWLFMPYRGYNRSEGKPGEAAMFQDACAVLDKVMGEYEVDPENVVLIGRSLGSGVAVHVASQRPIHSLVLITPYDSIAAVGQAHYPWLPVRLLAKHPFNSVDVAPNVKQPALFLAAGEDTIIPNRHSLRLKEAWGGETRWVVIPKANHNDISLWPAYEQALDAFLKR